MQEKVFYMCFFSVRMDISVPRDNCFAGTRQSVVFRQTHFFLVDGNFDSHLKPMKDTYRQLREHGLIHFSENVCSRSITRFDLFINKDVS